MLDVGYMNKSNTDNMVIVNNICQYFNLSSHLSLSWLMHKITDKEQHTIKALENVSLSISQGTTYALVGESGSGKSTLANIIAGLLKPSFGDIYIDGVNIVKESKNSKAYQHYRRNVQMVFQSPYASLNPRWKVASILAEPIKVFKLLDTNHKIQMRIDALLEQVGLSSSDGKKYPHEFSGGQRQRVSIARALASNARFIICDEPTSALDASVQAQVLNLLKSLQKDIGLTYLFITHDFAVVRTMAHHIGVLKNGILMEEQSADDLFASPQTDYTKQLLKATPKLK